MLLAGLVILTWSAISAEEGLGAALGSRGSDAVHRGGTAAAAAARRSRSCRPRSRTHRRLPCPRLRRYPTRIPAPPIAIGRDGHVTTDVHETYRVKGSGDFAYACDRRIDLTIAGERVVRYEMRVIG